ncbi:mitochondrial import inner membrane translocase subunit Tim10 B [Coccinella septempunctata]|uniref:mitochondrial import inner membrane translocase subunit Tim10 B n=1 Tax=Coccinella septempunctata TaxID=41139 RepID=UPI001D06AC49|nr:mitochondrial import inner membrane translocase subunit Tim10 B [Coccinella septempunctata]
MDIQANIRNFKDFLQLYNQMTETCFSKCVDNINSRKLDPNEIDCIEDCSSKFIKFNHRLMGTFMEAQSIIVNQRIKDVEEQQAKLAMENNDYLANTNVQGLSANA